jgi:hypothetical protein
MVTRLPYAQAFLAFLLMLGHAGVVLSAEDFREIDTTLKELSDPDGVKSSSALQRLSGLRHTVVERLLVLARSDAQGFDHRRSKYDAIRLLGEWRVEEASELLVQEIEFPELLGVKSTDLNPFSLYPAGRALLLIGGPAAEKIVERMANPVNDVEFRLFALLIQEIDGKELGRARLELALANAEKKGAKENLRRENLTRLLQLYKKLDVENIEDWPLPQPVIQRFKGFRRTPKRE